MKARTILVKNGTIITLGRRNRVLDKHALLIEGSTIRKIAPQASFRGKYSKVIDAGGKVIMPGLINAHMHFYSTLVRGLGKAKPSANFGEVLDNLWWRLDRKLTLEDSHISALIPLVDAIRKGTTTLIDHHASPFAVHGSLEAIARAVNETGLRASLCYEVSDRDGERIAEEGLEENAEFIAHCARENDPQLRALFGLHASFTVSNKTLEQAAVLASDLGAGFHVHTAEAASDQEHCVRTHGMRVVERFQKMGILGPRTICAHAVHIDEKEMELLADTDTAVVHNPQSNLNNAVGIADVLAMMKKGVLVGLGTDAMTVDMFAEMRTAVWAQKFRQANPGTAFVEMVGTLAFNNAKIVDRYWTGLGLGELREDGMADLILLDYLPPTELSEKTLLGHLCFGLAEATVDTTIVGGRILMEGKKLRINVDEERLAARSRELAAKLWKRF